jgi:hypothetical protein
MAVIHHTVLKPTKLELLTSWLPTRPWYVGGAGMPETVKAGGFRLDDPEGEVGIEFMVVTDTAGPHPAAYLVPLTYRGAPLEGAEHALVGTTEHGVLGSRWVYDGCHDPVLVAQLLALIEGRVQAQAQSVTDTPDLEVTRSYSGDAPLTAPLIAPRAASLAEPVTLTAADDRDGTALPAPQGTTLRVRRVLTPVPDGAALLPPGATGHVAGPWLTPSGTRERGLFAVLLPDPSA